MERDFTLKDLRNLYHDYSCLDEIAVFSSQDLNTDLIGCVREVLTPETANYISKFILQHLDHYLDFCKSTVNLSAVKEMEQLVSDLRNDFSAQMAPEVLAIYKNLHGKDLAVLHQSDKSGILAKTSLTDQIRCAQEKSGLQQSQNEQPDHNHANTEHSAR